MRQGILDYTEPRRLSLKGKGWGEVNQAALRTPPGLQADFSSNQMEYQGQYR